MEDTLGERIRLARRRRGWTQGELADTVGVSRSAVAQWETDRAGQVTGNFARIAAALDVSVDYLMTGRDASADGSALGDELAMVRLYRACEPADRQMLLRMARRFAQVPGSESGGD